MRIATYPGDVESLLRFLRGLGFRADDVEYDVIEVRREGQRRVSVVLDLQIWESIASGRDAEIPDS